MGICFYYDEPNSKHEAVVYGVSLEENIRFFGECVEEAYADN